MLLGAAAVPAPAEAAARTVVTISFDDALASQAAAPAILDAFGMRGSFFIPSGRVGTRGNLTWAQIRAIAAAGHEIGGHTLGHEDLTTVSLAEARRVVCQDRQNLVAQGFAPISFAYPFGHSNAEVASIAGECGYELARRHGGIRSPGGCSSCPAAESIPAPDPLQLRSSQSVRNSYTLADLQGYVLRAEQGGGGWINVNLHEVLPDCTGETYCIEIDLLRDFLGWLAPRASGGTVVLPMGEAFGAVAPEPEPTIVRLPFGSSWRYWGSWRDPGAGWMTMPLDSRWLSGTGQLGFGDGDERTRLHRSVWKSTSIYFRRTIQVEGAVRSARLQVLYDDGMAVFVNGVRVAAEKVGSLDHLAWATGASENAVATFSIPPSVFRRGANEIAVVVKQESPASDDLSFDLALELAVD